MGWARFDDGYTDHPKVEDAGPWAELLDMRAIIACARHDTDGRVTRHMLDRIKRGIPKVHEKVDRLVSVGRWRSDPDGGWYVNDFLEFNPSKAQREAQREANRERQAKWRRNAVSNADVTTGHGGESLKRREREYARCANCGLLELDCSCSPDLKIIEGGAGGGAS